MSTPSDDEFVSSDNESFATEHSEGGQEYFEPDDSRPTQSTRLSSAKTAREFWERWYADAPAEKIWGLSWKRKLLNEVALTRPKDSGKWDKSSRGIVDGSAISRDRNMVGQLLAKSTMLGHSKYKLSVDKLREPIESFGYDRLIPDHEDKKKWKLKEFKTSLFKHQVLGVSWMLSQEFSREGPFGGILADDMGLGKTVQVLATIVANRPTSEDKKKGQQTTLIVVPTSLRSQWYAEIRKHMDPRGGVRIFKSTAEDCNEDDLKFQKIVLATYGEVMGSIPWPENPAKNRQEWKKANPTGDYDKHLEKSIQHEIESNESVGPLHKFSSMLGAILDHEKIDFVYFTGDMDREQRVKAIEDFKTKKTTKVMVAGLKCGSLGLNLIWANRVIIVDPWWNVCVENQALGRVQRIGQVKPTYLVRIVVKDSVDSKILKLQNQKSEMIKDIMNDPPPTKLAKREKRMILEPGSGPNEFDQRDYSRESDESFDSEENDENDEDTEQNAYGGNNRSGEMSRMDID